MVSVTINEAYEKDDYDPGGIFYVLQKRVTGVIKEELQDFYLVTL